MRRSTEGDETWLRLLNWLKNQKASERLAAGILHAEKFTSVDPSHPLGGRDGAKDILCCKDNLTYVVGVYFPRGKQTFRGIEEKFSSDFKGVAKNNADGLVFITNQELTVGERGKLRLLTKDKDVIIYHLERLTSLLNTPANYAIRLEYLDIEMTKEELLSSLISRDQVYNNSLNQLIGALDAVKESLHTRQESDVRAIEELIAAEEEFFEKIWYNRHWNLRLRVKSGETTVEPEIWKTALNKAQEIEEKYGEENLTWDDFEWGMLNGKLSAIRWVLGEDWDFLDT